MNNSTSRKMKVKIYTNKLREFIGTPFHYNGRVKGTNGGVDCGGLFICAAQELNINLSDAITFNTSDNLTKIIDLLEYNCEVTKRTLPVPGDIILVRFNQVYHHLVYWTEDSTIIHTFLHKVQENKMPVKWLQSIHSIWRLKFLCQDN
jgi:hypothetical protein